MNKLLSDYIMKFVLASFAVIYVAICLCAFIPFLQGVLQLAVLIGVLEIALGIYMMARYKGNQN